MKRITKIEPTQSKEVHKTRVAAYCRVSTGKDEQLESLKTQRSHYEEYIKEHDDWEFAGLYYDEGITGTKKELRADLLRMLEDCREGKIDFILTKSISRFSRNKIDCLSMVRELLGLGIGIYFEKENINTKTMNDEFLLTILSSIAEAESQSISSNEKWGVIKRMQAGTFKQGMAPYGYDTKDGTLVINEEQAEIVQFIFKRTLAGAGSYKLAQELNEKSIPSPGNKKWYLGSVKGILRNERYIGDCLYQKTYTTESFVKKTNKGEVDQYYVENHHEPIISREDYERVQDLIDQRCIDKNVDVGSEKYNARYSFTHKLKCGECGSYLKHKYINGRVSGRYEAWACSGHILDKNSCSLKAIPQECIEAAFTTMLNKLIFSKKKLLDPFLKTVKNIDAGGISDRLAEIEEELDQNAKKDAAISNLAASGVLDAGAFMNAQAEIKAKRLELNTEKSMLAMRLTEGYKSNAEAIRLVQLIDHLTISTEFNKEAFESMVETAIVHSRTDISFKLKCGLEFHEEVKLK